MFLTSPRRCVGLSLNGRNWSIEHETQSKDTKMKYKYKLKGGQTLHISQRVPNGAWHMLPTPCYTLTVPGLGGKHNKLETTWDSLSRSARIEKKIYAFEDKRTKTSVEWKSNVGTEIGFRTKLDKGSPLVHSVAVSTTFVDIPLTSNITHGTGISTAKVSLKSKLSDGTKVKTTLFPLHNKISVGAKYKQKGDGTVQHWETVTIRMDATASLSSKANPKVQVGLEFEL